MTTNLPHSKTSRKKPVLSFLILFCFCINAFSQNNSDAYVRQYAADFFNAQAPTNAKLKSAVSASSLVQSYQSSSGVNTPLYVFQNGDKGFAMIARSNNVLKVVGYSNEGNFQIQNIPPQLRALMSHYEDSLEFNSPVHSTLKSGTVVVEPLLYEHNINLNQYHHPEVGDSWSGCMATAFTQIMLFHAAEQNKLVKGYGSHCYTYEPYGEICADFENATYDSAELLSFHTGIAMDMRYTNVGSSPPPEVNIIERFEEYFNYYMDYCPNEDFYIKNELQNRRPVYASIPGIPQNHAVVIDGYDDQGFFHLNFGWGGSFNGNFLVNNHLWYATGNGNTKFYLSYTNNYMLAPTPPVAYEQDSLALVAVYNALGGNEALQWDSSEPVCRWPGVLLLNGRVIRLSLNTHGLPLTDQSIAPEIGNLSALQELTIQGCLNGNIPSTITNLTELKKLNINNTIHSEGSVVQTGDFTGQLPGDIDELVNLEWLVMSNSLEGSIPASIGNLSSLNLLNINRDTTYFGKGGLTGIIPSTIGNLRNLRTLHISNQQISGALPAGISNIAGLWDVNLSGNQLSGTLPPLNLPNLEYLLLNDNQFSEIDEGEWNIPLLKILQLQNNKISGAVPPSFGSSSSLEYLDLSNNLIDKLPDNLDNLLVLETLKLDNNNLQALPDGLANIVHLKNLDAANNQLTYIPDNLGQSRMLETIDLSNNRLTSIPEALGNCDKLYEILFNNNRIERFPASFANIRHAATILLENNEMTGEIPEDLMTNANDNNTFVSLNNNRFIFADIPSSDELKFGVRDQKTVPLKKQVYKVQIGDTVTIDVRSISRLSHPANEYYWLSYPDFEADVVDEQLKGAEKSPVFKMVINQNNVHNKYYCKVFNPEAPSFTFNYDGSTVTGVSMQYLNTDTIVFQLASDEELLAEKHTGEFVTSLSRVANNSVSDGTVRLVPPLKVKRGEVFWEASADGVTWEKVSDEMDNAELQTNIRSWSSEELLLAPQNTAFYRCGINETNCEPLYSDQLKVEAAGDVIFNEIVDVTEESRTISVDSIEVLVPVNFHDEEFRLTITKLYNPPLAPDTVTASSTYDVSVSFDGEFEIPLLLKLKNIDKTKVREMEIDRFKAVYFDDVERQWQPFEDSHLSLKDSSVVFLTSHLTKLSLFWDNTEMQNGYTDVYERNNIRVVYKDNDTDFMRFGYGKNQPSQPWHVADYPLLVQDITEYLPVVIDKYASLGLSSPGGKFTVYVKKMDDAGCVGIMGMLSGYMKISRDLLKPEELRQVLAHEFMHYTQDYYISANPGNSFWMEAHATLSDRMVWNDKEVPVCEPEEVLEKGKTSNISIFNFLSNSWDYWDKSLLTNNLMGNIHYNYMGGNFLHYLRTYREGAKLSPATLLKETSWFGSWRTYLGSYVSSHLDGILGDEYEDYLKYMLSGKNGNFTVINKKGNPYSYLQKPKNKEVFTHSVTYRFEPEDEMIQKDEINISIPYMAAKVVLLENINPDKLVMVNYKRKHDTDHNHKVYYATYDFMKEEMTYLDISDSAEYNFLIDNRSEKNQLTEFKNYSFLLLINKEYIGAGSLMSDFNASIELTGMAALNVESVGLLDIYKNNSPLLHSFDNRNGYITIGMPNVSYLRMATEWDVTSSERVVSKQMINST
ncbi:C10 family peptidase, partial [Marinilabilia sp.]